MPIPEKIKNAPELHTGLDLFYLAFLDLNGCRSLGYGMVGPISWQTVDRYCEVYGLKGEQREDMFFFVGKMDAAYQEHQRSRQPK